MSFTGLPDELILSIIALLDPFALVPVQLVSRRFHRLARDSNLWKELCFDHSRFEVIRRRREWLAAQEEQLAQLRRAFQNVANTNPHEGAEFARSAAAQELWTASERRARALANWDPTYPGEEVDFYTEYKQRHGPTVVDWFEECRQSRNAEPAEAMGFGCLIDSTGELQHVAAPMGNGSLCIWNASSALEVSNAGRIIAQSAPGLLSVQRDASGNLQSISNETGAVENVSMDSQHQRGYFGVHDTVVELDLETLQVISRQQFPFPISCMSAAEPLEPLTIGTIETMHLFDPRTSNQHSSFSQIEQIGGVDPSISASLTQPGPLSIRHHPLPSAPNEIWVGGRFKSLLCYDRRFWPRVSKTLYSGARVSSMAVLPYPFLGREIDLMHNTSLSITERLNAKQASGATLMTAGEYRGKGSLELYNLAPDSSNRSSSTVTAARYQNRQTASRTRLLSVAPHGTRIVYTDGDGNLKWTERDGNTLVREFNINDHIPRRERAAGARGGAEIRTIYHDRADSGIGTPSSVSSDDGEAEAEGVFAQGENGDIVQRVVPTGSKQDDLLIWTGDGRLGTVGFGRGRGPSFGKLAKDGTGDYEDDDRDEREEHLFGMRMRRALERQADEARFVRNLGMGGRWRP